MIEAIKALKARIGDVLTPESETSYHVNFNATQNQERDCFHQKVKSQAKNV